MTSQELVCRILRAEYADMVELLKDNREEVGPGSQWEHTDSLGRVTGQVGSPRCAQLGTMLRDVYGYGGLQLPREGERATGLPDHDYEGGQEVWWERIAALDAAFRQQVRSFDFIDYTKGNQCLRRKNS